MTWLPPVLIIWAMGLVTFTVFRLVSLMDTLDTITSTVATLIIGILTTALGFYIRNREINQIVRNEQEIELTKAKAAFEGAKR